jgi:Ca2+-binding RTX toxin-like protein
MRRILLLLTTMAVALVAASGVAYAINQVQCDGTGDQDPASSQCRGTNLSDGITGTEQPDLIVAMGGFDDVSAGGGQDELHGGPNADTLRGAAGSDTYNGGAGNDWLDEAPTSDAGNDVMNGNTGTDYLERFAKRMTLYANHADSAQSYKR